MVNNLRNLSIYTGQPPSEEGEKGISTDNPLYEVDQVLEILVKGDEKTIPWTRDCKSDLQKYSLDRADARQLVKEAITEGRYLNSQWCLQKAAGPWAACDGYHLFRDEWVENARKMMRFEYYVKFAIGSKGNILLLVSCHLSQ